MKTVMLLSYLELQETLKTFIFTEPIV